MRKLFFVLMMAVFLPGLAMAATTVNTDITTNTTWTTAGSPYNVTTHVYVRNGATLTIDAGVTVQISHGVYLQVANGSEAGAIVANGTSGSPIIITSPDANSRFAAVYINPNAAATSFTYCQFSKGGNNGGFVMISGGIAPSFANCTFSGGTTSGVYISDTAAPIFTNCTFSGNAGYGLNAAEATAAPSVSSSTFSDNGNFAARIGANYLPNIWSGSARAGNNTFTPNASSKKNAIEIMGGNVSVSATWAVPPSGFCYYVTGDVFITNISGGTPTLTLISGTVIKFETYGLYVASNNAASWGKLVANGVTFTSYRDDTVGGGDTNNDGLGTSPGGANWRGIYFYPYAQNSSSLTNCTVRYGGVSYGTNVYVSGLSPTFTGCTFSNANSHGVFLNGVASPVFSGCNFSNNGSYGLYIDDTGATPSVSGSTFSGNGNFPVRTGANNLLNIWSGATRAGNNTFTPNGNGKQNAIEIFGGNVSVSATWAIPPSGFCYYVTGDVFITNTAGGTPTLTLISGTVIKFETYGLYVASNNAAAWGKLVANGVTFTSYRDDTVGGGDTNNDGLSTNPGGANWRGIYFYPYAQSSSSLTNSTVRYGGVSYGTNVYVNNLSPTFTGCTFSNANSHGVFLNGVASPAFSGCNFSNNGLYGLYMDNTDAAPSVSGSTFAGNGNFPVRTGANNLLNIWSGSTRAGNNTFTPNGNGKLNAIEIFGGNVSVSATWPVAPNGFCYYVTDDIFITNTAGGTPTLTLISGTVLKFETYGLYVASNNAAAWGKLVANGVTFTSYRDDTVGGGDTNNDGASTSPGGANWRGIYFYPYAQGSSSLTNCTVRYGGVSYGTNVYLSSLSPTFTNCMFSNANQYGVRLTGVSSPTFTGCGFTNNGINGLYMDNTDAAPSVSGSTFSGNGNFPVRTGANNLLNIWSGATRAGNNTFTPNGNGKLNAIEIFGGEVRTSATWPVPPSGFCYYVTDDIYITNISGGTPTLTLISGTVLKFETYGLYVASNSAAAWGKLIANGVTFTSYRDDTVGGGDTNNDGASTSPGGANWRGIYFYPYAQNSSSLTNCTVRYGGVSYGTNVYVSSLSPTFTNCTFSNSNQYGVRLEGTASSTFTGCSFINNGSFGNGASYGLYTGTVNAAPTLSGCTFSGNGYFPVRISAAHLPKVWNGPGSNTYTANGSGKLNAIDIYGGTISSNLTWAQPPSNFCYWISDGITVDGASVPTFTIANNSVLKFNSGTGLYIGSSAGGKLMADDVTFTSYRDDTVGGDTNNDGVNLPAGADWQAIYFFPNAASSSQIANSSICYGGQSWNTNLYISGMSPTITNTTICKANNYGVYTTGASAQPNFTGCTLNNNGQYGLYAQTSSKPTFTDGNIFSNGTYGVYNATSNVLNFTNNWWGDSSGPTHATNPTGTGDDVTNNVDFSPWDLTSNIPESVAPTNLLATAVSSSQINLTWTDVSSSENGFVVERKAGADTFAVVTTLAANTTSYSSTGLNALTNYIYRVRGFVTGGASGYSNEASATTLSAFNWSVNLLVQGDGLDFPLIFGTSPTATNGYEPTLDSDTPPPGTGYYAYFSIPVTPLYLDADIRSSSANTLTWTLKIVNAAGKSDTLTWTPGSLPATGSMMINGTINMRTQSMAIFTGDQTITITYSAAYTVTVNLQTGWNLVSVAVDPDEPAIQDVFPGKTVYTYNPLTRNYYVPTFIEPGRGYWVLNLNETQNVNIIGDAVTSFTVNLNAGWFLLGATNAAVPFASLVDAPDNSIIAGSLFAYNPTTNQYEAATQLEPNKGYWIASLNNCSVMATNPTTVFATLEIPSFEKMESLAQTASLSIWTLDLKLTTASDERNLTIGQAENATDGFDAQFDALLPPLAPGDQAALNFSIDHAGEIFSRYLRDIRSAFADDKTFVLTLNLPADALLTWNLTGALPSSAKLYLDGQEMALSNTEGIALKASTQPIILTITLDQALAVDPNADAVTEFALSNYPNPSESFTTIYFAMPYDETVSLMIYNAGGQKVRTLLNRQTYLAGRHTLNWNGLNDAGQPVGSGIYFYRLETSGKELTRKMILTR